MQARAPGDCSTASCTEAAQAVGGGEATAPPGFASPALLRKSGLGVPGRDLTLGRQWEGEMGRHWPQEAVWDTTRRSSLMADWDFHRHRAPVVSV